MITNPHVASDRLAPGRKVPLRQQLFWLTLGTLFPVLVFALTGAVLLAQHERSAFARSTSERTLAILSAVDTELRSTITSLQVLAASKNLESDDLAAFHDEAVRARATHPHWLSINLADVSGRQILSILRPFGSDLPAIQERASFQRVLDTAKPSVSSVITGALTKQPDFSVRVPIVRDGAVRYVLSAVVKPDSIFQLWQEQRLPERWVGVVVDRDKRFVARTVANAERLGQLASKDLQAAINASPQGWLEGRTVEGSRVYTAHQTSSFSGWSVALGVPADVVEAGAWLMTVYVLGGTLAAIGVGFLLARWLGRRIAEPIGALAESANALARGEGGVVPPSADIVELAELGGALGAASAAVHARDELQRQLEAVTDNATVALFMIDTSHRCTFMNPAAERMTGYSFGEIRDRPLHEIVHRGQITQTSHSLHDCSIGLALVTNQHRQGHDVYMHRNGHCFDVAYATSPLRVQGTPVGAIIEARDVTAETAVEAERSALLAREHAARTEAEASNKAKDEFLAMLGHELRNPLSAISNASHLLDQQRGDQLDQARGVIKRQASHLGRLVDDLLDAGRVASGKIVLAEGPVDLAGLTRRTLATLDASGRTQRHQVTLNVDQAWVLGDETRLEQIVTNLLTNALRYTPAGGRIDVGLKTEGHSAVLTVADTGIGIPSEMLPRVFDLFVQGDRGLERAHGGLGIGLTLVKRLTELHRGSVEVVSAGVDQGSAFTLRMPTISPPEQSHTSVVGDTPETVTRKVLLIEDNEDARAMLRVILELDGHVVTECADGPGGLLAALALRPDVAVIDVGLPGLSGYEVARSIRTSLNGDSMRLVALTGYGQPQDRIEAIGAGFDAHLVKPVSAPDLLAAVNAGQK